MPAVVETAVLTIPSPIIPASLTSVKSLSLPPSSPVTSTSVSSSSSSTSSSSSSPSSSSSSSPISLPSTQMAPSIVQTPPTTENIQEPPSSSTPSSSSSPPKDEFLQLLYLPHNEEELFQTWKLWTKTKGVLTNGNRLENASWRRWYQKKYNIRPLSSEFLAPSSLPALLLPQEKEISPSKARVSQIFQQDFHLSKSHSVDEASSKRASEPPKKIKKRVTFDESKNQTAFVSYADEQWEANQQPEMLLNVDELSRVKLAKLNLSHLLTNDPDLKRVIQAKESLMYPAGFDPSKYAESPLPGSPYSPASSSSSSSSSSPLKKKKAATEPVEVIALPKDDSNPLSFLKELEDEDGMIASIIEVFFEIILFLRWCASLFFISPAQS